MRKLGGVFSLRKRLLIPALATLVLAVALVATGAERQSPTAGQAVAALSKPNIVVIETDDQTRESMKVMDNVNSLIGDQGVRFTRSFVNFSLCCPSRSTFLTGQYAHNHGVLSNMAPNGGFDRFQSLHGENNLAIWLQDAGYYTGLVGKYLNGYPGGVVPDGWNRWFAATPNDQSVYDYELNENGRLVDYGHDPSDFKQDVLTSKALDFVSRRAPKGKPFFLWLTYTAPHAQAPDTSRPNPPFDCGGTAQPAPRHANAFDSEPLPRSPNFNEADVSDKPAAIRDRPLLTADQITDIQRRYRCELESLLSVDEGVKKVVDALQHQGDLADTLLIFTSDNGFFHGEHRIPNGKMHIYEESIRVPLEMRGPGIPQGENVSDLAINADLAPTIVDFANATPGLVMDGRSLIPVAQNPGIEQGRELLIEEPSFQAIRTGRYMYAEHRSGARELYDLTKDPFELQSRNADPAYATVRKQLAADLAQLRTCSGSSCRIHR